MYAFFSVVLCLFRETLGLEKPQLYPRENPAEYVLSSVMSSKDFSLSDTFFLRFRMCEIRVITQIWSFACKGPKLPQLWKTGNCKVAIQVVVVKFAREEVW